MLIAVFSLASGLSAFLLFWVQPLITKMLLPMLGGAPAVWNTAMMFFQITLLVGYLYAHLLTRLRPWQQAVTHGALLLAAGSQLPFGVDTGLSLPEEGAPILWLLATLARLVGLPFLALSASAPLIQAWFGRTTNRGAGDPYFLYAASNAGSLVSLLAFPLVLERLLPLPAQARVWTWGFALLIPAFAACFLATRRADQAAAAPAEVGVPPGWGDRLLWVTLALVPSSLLLGVTSYISTDLAAVPLLWVVPLALYLLTFIIAFGRLAGSRWIIPAQGVGIVAITVLLLTARVLQLPVPVWVSVPAHIIGFFAIALGCHTQLARRRPPAARLTEFYLWMSVGGALGGIFNALLAPVLFSSTYEYDICLGLACALRLTTSRRWRERPFIEVCYAIALLCCATLAVVQVRGNSLLSFLGETTPRVLILALFTAGLLWFSRHALRFALSVTAFLAAGLLVQNTIGITHQQRSFFGVLQVRSIDHGKWHGLMHGDTLHGVESTDPAHWKETSTYYVATGPAGQFLSTVPSPRRVAAIGLGTGGLACFRRPGEAWTFFEIDPAVISVANDARFFHYLAQCGSGIRTAVGDGRLLLAAEPDGAYELIILDAFSSDSIPVHLLTREALALYLRKLAPHGHLLVHISNRYLELEPVLASGLAELGASALAQFFTPKAEETARWATPSNWVAVAAAPSDLDFLRGDARWRPLRTQAGFIPWADDYSNILGVLRW